MYIIIVLSYSISKYSSTSLNGMGQQTVYMYMYQNMHVPCMCLTVGQAACNPGLNPSKTMFLHPSWWAKPLHPSWWAKPLCPSWWAKPLHPSWWAKPFKT